MTAAIIGSFNQHYAAVLEAMETFRAAGIEVLSPAGEALVEGDEVRFESDDAQLTEAQLEAATLARVLTADFVYVLAPGGYVGRATAYELGRLIEAGRELYFSERVLDPPIEIAPARILSPAELVAAL